MNLAQVARILSGFTLFFSLLQGIPLLVAIYLDEPLVDAVRQLKPVEGFAMGMGAGLLTSGLLFLAGRGAGGQQFFRKEGLTVVGTAWLVAGLLGAIPFHSSGALPTPADAVFETVSGLTTTGASVLGAEATFKIEQLPMSLLLWRSLLQWIGGLGIILVFIVLLPAMGVTGKNLLSSEQVGVSSESLRPRMQEQARALFRLYLILTTLAALTYWIISDEVFASICHAFTTMASGGFSTKDNSIAFYNSWAMELAVIGFMFLSGCNFVLMLNTAKDIRRPLRIFKNPEFRLYFAITIFLILVVTICLWAWNPPSTHPDSGRYDTLMPCLRDAAFAVVSIITSTGYAIADYQSWPSAALLILMFCMFVGGCSGSTAGGFKIVRLLVVHKVMAYNLRHFIRPKSVEKIRVGHNVVPNPIIAAILAMLLLWMGVVALGTLALCLDGRLHVFDCFAMNLSMLGCTGPAITAVDFAGTPINGSIDVGPAGSYGDLYPWSKILLCFQMVLGRLELLVPLALLTPGFWRR